MARQKNLITPIAGQIAQRQRQVLDAGITLGPLVGVHRAIFLHHKKSGIAARERGNRPDDFTHSIAVHIADSQIADALPTVQLCAVIPLDAQILFKHRNDPAETADEVKSAIGIDVIGHHIADIKRHHHETDLTGLKNRLALFQLHIQALNRAPLCVAAHAQLKKCFQIDY